RTSLARRSIRTPATVRRYAMTRALPLHGAQNPSSRGAGTNPGSFARAADIGGPYTFSSPDTPGMPLPSEKTAWDFLPEGWRREGDRAVAPPGFRPVTQLEHARLGIVTDAMRRAEIGRASCRAGGPAWSGAGCDE